MWRFLSVEWVDALDRAASAQSPAAPTTTTVVVEQHVLGGPEGDVVYHMALGPDGWHARTGAGPTADLVLRTDYDTAVALHRGTRTAQDAIAAGRLRITGDLDRVRDLVGALGDPDSTVPLVATELVDHDVQNMVGERVGASKEPQPAAGE
jgi:hypothetical protein